MRNKEHQRQYDKECRDERIKRFYNSPEWRATRRYKLNLDPTCQSCRAKGELRVAELIHHLIPLDSPEGWEHRLNLTFLQSVCYACHNQVESELDHQRNGEKAGKAAYD